MALAEVTYNAGISYRIRKYKFLKNRTQRITDPEVIARAEITKGFSVLHITPDKPAKKEATKRVMRKVVEDEAPKKTTKKKSTSKKKGLFGRSK